MFIIAAPELDRERYVHVGLSCRALVSTEVLRSLQMLQTARDSVKGQVQLPDGQ
jgi:hypothetical protein